MMLIEDQINQILTEELKPTSLEVINDSHKHKGHAGDDGTGQTHFTVKIVSDIFENQSRVDRQRTVMKLLKPCFDAGLHALSLQLKTLDEKA